MSSGLPYCEYAPSASMAPFVECFWTQRIPSLSCGTILTHNVVPDGCIDIILRSRAGEGVVNASIAGAMTHPVIVAFQEGDEFVAVRFRPGGAFAVLGIPVGEFTDRDVPLESIWSRSVVDQTCDLIAECRSNQQRIRLFESLLSKRCKSVQDSTPWLGQAISALSTSAADCASIEKLCSNLGVSRQQLARVFRDRVGLRPKQLARITRLRHLFAAAKRIRDSELSWCSMAAEFGYYDQAHLINECRELTGATPAQYLVRC